MSAELQLECGACGSPYTFKVGKGIVSTRWRVDYEIPESVQRELDGSSWSCVNCCCKNTLRLVTRPRLEVETEL